MTSCLCRSVSMTCGPCLSDALSARSPAAPSLPPSLEARWGVSYKISCRAHLWGLPLLAVFLSGIPMVLWGRFGGCRWRCSKALIFRHLSRCHIDLHHPPASLGATLKALGVGLRLRRTAPLQLEILLLAVSTYRHIAGPCSRHTLKYRVKYMGHPQTCPRCAKTS